MTSKLMSVSRRRAIGAPVADPEPVKSQAPPLTADRGGLYRRHAPDVTRWARRLGICDADLEDVVHDVFIVAFRRLAAFDPARAAFGTWLFGVTANIVHARRRRERWRAAIRRAIPWWSDETGAVTAASASDAVERGESSALLGQLLDGIGEKYRTVIVMFELEGVTCEEIAEAVGCSVENVYVRIHRGRKMLAAALARRKRGSSDD